MIRCIAKGVHEQLDVATMKQLSQSVDSLIEKTTGIQTIIQMKHLVSLIRKFGFVKEEEVLTPKEYKEIYNTSLLEHIEKKNLSL